MLDEGGNNQVRIYIVVISRTGACPSAASTTANNVRNVVDMTFDAGSLSRAIPASISMSSVTSRAFRCSLVHAISSSLPTQMTARYIDGN